MRVHRPCTDRHRFRNYYVSTSTWPQAESSRHFRSNSIQRSDLIGYNTDTSARSLGAPNLNSGKHHTVTSYSQYGIVRYRMVRLPARRPAGRLQHHDHDDGDDEDEDEGSIVIGR